MELQTIPLMTLKQLIDDASVICLSTHIDLDGDAIGCVLALDSFLSRRGKKTIVLCQDAIPEAYAFLGKQWTRAEDRARHEPYDLHVVVDCPSLARIGRAQQYLEQGKPVINIDHHVSNERYGTENVVICGVSATAELVLQLLDAWQEPLTAFEATCLYVGLSTDTGSFRFSNTTHDSFVAAARLAAYGVDLATVNERLYASYPHRKFDLIRFVLPRVEFDETRRVGWCVLEAGDFKTVGAHRSDTEGVIDYIRNIDTVVIALFLVGVGENKTKVSLRAKQGYDVDRIARHFGGGGHAKAAGCTIMQPPRTALASLRQVIDKAL